MEQVNIEQEKLRPKFVSFWLWFCIFVNIIGIIRSIVAYQSLGNLGNLGMNLIIQGVDLEPFSEAIQPHVLILQIVAFVSGVLIITGYSKLLHWKKSGFWIIVITAIVTAIVNIIMMNFIKHDYALVNLYYKYNPILQSISTLFSILILWAILQIKRDGVRYWKNLE